MEKLTRKQWKTILVIAVTLAALAIFAFAARRYGFLSGLSKERLQDFIAGFGIWGPVVFILMQCGQVIFSFVPGNLTTLAGGALFGFWGGFFYSYAAIIAGSLIAFWLARKMGHVLVRKKAGGKTFDKYYGMIQSQGALSRTRLTLIVAMLLPFFPDDLICLLAGLTALPFWQFVAIVVLARPWGLLVSALVGAGALRVPGWILILAVPVSLALGALAFRFAPAIEKKTLSWLHRISDKKRGK